METLNSNVIATSKASSVATEANSAEIAVVKRFTISVNGVKESKTCQFTDKNGKTWVYNQAIVFDQLKDHFNGLPCWAKYKNYTATHAVPKFVRELPYLVEQADQEMIDAVDVLIEDALANS